MSERRTRKPYRSILAGFVGLAVLAMGFFMPDIGTTDAAWVDREHASADFTAARLKPPQIQTVVNCSGLLGLGILNGVTMEWTWPNDPLYEGFAPAANARWAFNAAGDNWQAVATQDLGDGVYRTTFNTGVISDLIGLLVGGQITFRVRTIHSEWVSATSSSVTFDQGFLGLNPSCTAPVNGE